jgi:hypothetical protein
VRWREHSRTSFQLIDSKTTLEKTFQLDIQNPVDVFASKPPMKSNIAAAIQGKATDIDPQNKNPIGGNSGLSFFYGRTIYFGIDGKKSQSLGPGPFNAIQ